MSIGIITIFAGVLETRRSDQEPRGLRALLGLNAAANPGKIIPFQPGAATRNARGNDTQALDYVVERLLPLDDAALDRDCRGWSVPRYELSPPVFDKLAFGHRHDGVIAVARIPARSIAEFLFDGAALVAVLEGIEKPGNVGAILRTADAAGVGGVLVCDAASDLYNPNCIRASMGTLFSQNVCVTTSAEALSALQQRRFRLFAARVDGEIDYTEADFTQPAAIILGSEAYGLSDVWRAAGVATIRLPQFGIADSLNVSVTAAVLFYEAVRQRRGKPTARD